MNMKSSLWTRATDCPFSVRKETRPATSKPMRGSRQFSTTVCRMDEGDCDVAENCPGDGVECPADAFEPAETSCGDTTEATCDHADT